MHAQTATALTPLLLVEDEPALARALQLALERRGFEVVHCADGSSALQRLRHDPPAAVLLDLGLPGMDGLQVLHRARAEGVRVPVLVLTARPSTSTSSKPACARCCGAAAPTTHPRRWPVARCVSTTPAAPSTSATRCWKPRRVNARS
jgi:CheY-like chemotaxis protein